MSFSDYLHKYKLYIRRLFIIMAITTLAVLAFSEAAFRFQTHNLDRAPQEVEIIIPEGTAKLVAAGSPVPSIPDEMVFVLGDVLVVRNEDVVTHELGPILVPAGSTATLSMDQAENFLLSCSFNPSSYLGFDVIEPTTWETRLLAIVFAAPPTAFVAFLYSIAAAPIDLSEEEDQ